MFTIAVTLLSLFATKVTVCGFLVQPTISHLKPNTAIAQLQAKGSRASSEEYVALTGFHRGRWMGKARSFTVVPDVAAGVVDRKAACNYEVSVHLDETKTINGLEQCMTEIYFWDEQSATRTLSFNYCNMDVDSEDASYSLDSVKPEFPTSLFGMDRQDSCRFLIEHCLAIANDARMKCFVLYDENLSLQRFVICEETRQRFPSLLPGKSSTTTREPIPLTPRQMSISDIATGIWRGDAFVRDNTIGRNSASEAKTDSFANWVVGVQKVEWEWNEDNDYGIQQVTTPGRALGATLDKNIYAGRPLGQVCVDESSSSWIPKEDRMIYLDLMDDMVAILAGPVAIQVPRHLPFSRSSMSKEAAAMASFALKKLYCTEFSVFFGTEDKSKRVQTGPDAHNTKESQTLFSCSRLLRVYGSQGDLRQGCSSFYEREQKGKSQG